ncbi:thiamine phosphate synthase [Schnuerera sp. xch1]|uniref:thiamine phosphate synthase n=1 Tax=Schnuerera sp. xch1 TaxID=2874283 RepID=UPI001CBE3758|nr:thiamine phosphate synthase [Schnuerera sp. xch1]MBZ2174276.1 thiamine phosphate synthase [Schnuerera sp. xch1]
MKLDKHSMLLYAITDRRWLRQHNLSYEVEEALKGGTTFVQLREKNITFDEFVKLAKDIKAVTDKYKVPFVINDNVDIASIIDADGVHIGQDDEGIKTARERLGINKIIGVSASTVKEAIEAEKNGADYIGVGSIFNTTSKLDADNVSLSTLKEICKSVNIPVVAIGGISNNNILELSGSGIDGVAVISAIFAQVDIKEATRELLKLSKQVVDIK